jgi:hypothetical protein
MMTSLCDPLFNIKGLYCDIMSSLGGPLFNVMGDVKLMGLIFT